MEATDEQAEQFSATVQSALMDKTWSMADLARALGREHETVRGWVRMKREPPRSVVFEMEEALDLGPGELSRKLGYLPLNAVPAVSVPDAIRVDVALRPKDASVLIAAYERFIAGR